MKKRRIFKLGIIFLILIGLFFKINKSHENFNGDYDLEEGYINYENIKSRNAIIIDRDKKTIIGGKNPYDKIHPASMTKVMTAIVGIENRKNLRKRIIITEDIINYCQEKGMSLSGFQVGDKPSINDLLYGILLESGGESSIALAREIGGSEEGFTSLMNEKAKELGMLDTNFSNSTGITHEENYTSPKDMAILFDYALENKEFKKIIISNDYRAYGFNGLLSKHDIYNQLFQKRNILDIDKDYIKGGKTGYTEAAGLCLVSFGQLGDKEYIVVTAGAEGDPNSPQYNLLDTLSLYESILPIRQ